MSPSITPDQCRAARALLNWSQDQLAEAATVQQRTIARYESGEVANPHSSNMAALIDAFSRAGVAFIYGTDIEGVVRARMLGKAHA